MTKDALKEFHVKTFQKCLNTMLQKNEDYNGHEDALGNFKDVEERSITSSEVGVRVRINDKYNRMCNLFATRSNGSHDESLDDTIDDMINYLIILKAVMQDKCLTNHV